ncbi:MAG: flagellar motor switch protein FliM, partial [Chloroflexota bacterium]|nr:flagellar motor switch protein FliM [Chloroflexota bacterium]
GTLRTPVTINLASIEHGIYDEFLQSLKTPTILNIISMEPLPGNGLLEIEMSLAFALVERLLGGAGKAWNRNRELTDLELVIIRGIGATIVNNLRDAWINVMEIEPKLEDITQSPQFARVALPTDSVLTIAFEVRLGDLTSGMSVCIPYPVLEPVLARLNPQIWISGSRRAALKDSAELVRKNMNAVSVPLTVLLGGADISMDELLKLNAGDVIRLDTLANRELDVLVGGQPKFRARPGLSGKRLAVKVTDLYPEA